MVQWRQTVQVVGLVVERIWRDVGHGWLYDKLRVSGALVLLHANSSVVIETTILSWRAETRGLVWGQPGMTQRVSVVDDQR
jgi:hypothetical protein